MNFYSDETYGEKVAGVYDDWYTHVDPHAIDLLAELAGDGRALELGIGTGRIALPLVSRNVNVSGIDAAQSMIDRLSKKPNADKIKVYKGSFADVDVEGQFELVYVVFNTFFALASQDEQVRCFRNVAAHLTDAGSFLIEAFVPNLNRFTGGQVNWATKVTEEVVELDVGQHDAAAQRVVSQKVVLKDGSVKLYPVQIRYAWPSELELMAQLAGLRLRERWGSWQRGSFDSDSGKHISIYERAK
ncbi:MAG TPA: class I SAM-dependent methyltransferase [Pyrinomonadaceae bacterium]|nr:class I SAM-dependent methyltransferase [Pyrinomonadaceae bacterium]